MIRFSKIVLASFFALSLFSFCFPLDNSFVGVYGVSDNDPSAIELKINADETFSYKDFSNPEKKIDVTGNWVLKNSHIVLTNYTSDYSFHNKWKVVNDGKSIKSRKGLTFYTLSKQCLEK